MSKQEKYISLRTYRSGKQGYYVLIRLNGQTFRKTLSLDDFPTKAAALSAAVKVRDEQLVRIRAGKLVTKDTVKDIYKKSYDLIPVRYQTRSRHDIYFKNVLKPFEDIPLKDITVADIQLSVNEYAKTHTRYETGKMLAVWRRLYKAANMLEIDISDKTAAVQLPEGITAKHRNVDLSLEDFYTFCDALKKYNSDSISGTYNCKAVYYALLVMLYCGLRPAEAYAISREDIDLKRRIILIRSAVGSDKESYPVIASTKTEQSIRAVPIPAQLAPVLTEALAWSKYDIVFAKYSGHLLTSAWVNTLKQHIIKAQKLDIDFRPYQLRHLFSTDLHRSGVNPAVIRDLMGHESASMSLDYAVSSPEERKKAVESLRKQPSQDQKKQ